MPFNLCGYGITGIVARLCRCCVVDVESYVVVVSAVGAFVRLCVVVVSVRLCVLVACIAVVDALCCQIVVVEMLTAW